MEMNLSANPSAVGSQYELDRMDQQQDPMARLGNRASAPIPQPEGPSEQPVEDVSEVTKSEATTTATVRQSESVTHGSAITDDNDAFAVLTQMKSQIVNQTGLALLSQANQRPSDVVSLFR